MRYFFAGISLLIIIVFSCQKEKTKRPSTLYISGTVLDIQTSAPLDSVRVTINDANGTITIPTNLVYYTNAEGKFSFQFTPEKNSYSLRFSKSGYCYGSCEVVYLDRDKEYQDFKVNLTK